MSTAVARASNVRDHTRPAHAEQQQYKAAAFGPPPPVDASPTEKGLYSFARYTVQNEHYAGFFQTWTKTILFLLNRQWLVWNASARRYGTATDVPPWRQQPVTNVTYAVYRTLAAKLTKQKPTLEVVPPSGDSDDREAAALGEAVLTHLWRLLKTPAKLRRAIGWYLCTGQVYLRVYWNPEAGPPRALTVPVPHPKTGEDVPCACDDDGEPLTKPDGSYDLDAEPTSLPRGEIALAVEDPMSVRFDPEATDADDAREMYVAKLMTRSRACSLYKLDDKDIEANSDSERALYSDLISSAAAGSGWTSAENFLGSQQEVVGERVLVVEYYHDRDPDNGRPDGAHWISIGGRVVWPKQGDRDFPNGEAPLPNGFWPPLIPALSLPIPGQPQALGILPQVVPLNEQLNTLDGRIMEHEVMMAMGGKWIGHPDDKGLVINTDPGQFMLSKGYAQGKPPIQAKLNALPAEVYAERAVIMDKIRTVMSLSEAELGRKPEGVSAGRAFLVLQEVTDSALGPDLQVWEDVLEEVGRRELVLAQQHYTDDRTIAIRGERGKWEVRSFTGADLSDGLDVRVQAGSSFPWSKSAQLDTKLNILSTFPGLFTNPQTQEVDQERFAEFLEIGGSGLQSFAADEDPNLVEVEREHAMFAAYDPQKGEQQLPQLAFWQAHPKHLEAHFRFMKRDYARFERFTPDAQAAFLDHIRQTMAAVDELAGQVAAATQPPTVGAPGAPGEAAPGEVPNGAAGEAPEMGDMGGGGGEMTAQERPTLAASDYDAAEPMLAGASA